MVLLLRRAKRVRVSFEPSRESLDGMSLILDTELIRYKWIGFTGNYPDWAKLIPAEFNTVAHFDAVEALRAVSSLKVLADSKSYPIDLTIGDGKIVMSNPDNKGLTELNADTEGEVKVRIDSGYLAQALKACGGMVDYRLTNAYSPTLFTADGYQLVVMPMATTEAQKRDREAKAKEAEPATTEPVAQAEAKPKRSRKRDKVAVA